MIRTPSVVSMTPIIHHIDTNTKWCHNSVMGTRKGTHDWQSRYWANVHKTDGCWLWTGTYDAHGYGTISIDNKARKAHRIAMFLHTGEVLEGQFVCHACDVRHCVNPDHLYLGTHADNLRDMALRGRFTNQKIYAVPKNIKPKPTISERFWAKVDKTGDCWLWTGSLNHDGYGNFGLNRASVGAHRVAYELSKGPIAKGLHVCHSCDTPGCVNPDHLFLGSRDENIADRHRKGRSRGPARERHPNTKLTREQLKEIQIMHSTGAYTFRKIGEIYGVDYTHVSRIVKGRYDTE